VARQLAPSVRAVVAVDATVAMLEQGRARGVPNVIFLRADAAALPFLDASFDVVVSRFAVHHFEEPAMQLAEMRRCVKPRGRLAIADLVADPAAADQIRDAPRAELQGGPPTGLRPRDVDAELRFTHTMASLIG
jgi:ubiquinone/menaquinone biosynthesis C-methylase UbiE